MRLLDQVAHALTPLMIADTCGTRVMPGVADCAILVASCDLHYVLDESVAAECRHLGADAWTMLSDLPAMAMPSKSFWLEWAEEDGRRTGVLVTEETGSSGFLVETFWEQDACEPVRGQARTRLGVNILRSLPDGAPGQFLLAPGSHLLSDHAAFDVGTPWLRHFAQSGGPEGRSAVKQVVADVLASIEMLCAFVALLATRSALLTSKVERRRINKSRTRDGKRILLDHLTVSLNLSALHQTREDQSSIIRRGPRMHQVRGHIVLRGGRMFWRRSHLRGVIGQPTLSRTVIVNRRP